MFTAITAIPIIYGTSKHMYYTGREGATRDGGGGMTNQVKAIAVGISKANPPILPTFIILSIFNFAINNRESLSVVRTIPVHTLTNIINITPYK